MIGPLWTGVGGGAVKHWAAHLFSSAAFFWLAGLSLVWFSRHGEPIDRLGWVRGLTDTTQPYQKLTPLVAGVLLALLLCVIAASALAVQALTPRLLRLLEGYGWLSRWPAPRWIERRAKARERAMAVYQALTVRPGEVAGAAHRTAHEEERLARATQVLRTTPAARALVLPTRLGNILRSAELRPLRKHGIDAVSCWPHLWLVMPADTRTELVTARSALDRAVRVWLWGVLFVVWTPWAWWACLAALVAAVLAYGNCLRVARTYAVLVETAFDVNLSLLYAAASLPAPRTGAEATAHGQVLSRYLTEGSDDPAVHFTTDGPRRPAASQASPTAPNGRNGADGAAGTDD